MTEAIILNDGNRIPAVGLGVFQIPADGSTYAVVEEALEVGYRHTDITQTYFNEKEARQAIKDSSIPRDEISVTSKLRIQDYVYETAKATIDVTLEKIRLDYFDLYLLHQPYDKVEKAWKVLEEIEAAGKIKSIDVSNLTLNSWNQLASYFNIIPAVNQVEFDPYFQRKALRSLLAKDDVKIRAWAPLGRGNKGLFAEPIITVLANKYGKDARRITLRFEMQEGIVVLPRPTKKVRMASNKEFFDFELIVEEMAELCALDRGRGAHDPNTPGVGDWLLSNYDVHAND